MTDENKARGKAIQKELREKRINAILTSMPISIEEFKNLVAFIESSGGCDHSLHQTQTFLKHHKDLDKILTWLREHGGYCDCEVILNVALGYLSDLFPTFQDENHSPKKYELMLSRKNTLKPTNERFETEFFVVEKLPSPWKLYLQSNPDKVDKAHFCFGKKGLGTECKLIYLKEKSPAVTQVDILQLWSELTHLPLSNLNVEEQDLPLKNGDVAGTIVSTPGYMPVYGWFTTKSHPDWHFVFISTQNRKSGDIQEIKKLLQLFLLK